VAEIFFIMQPGVTRPVLVGCFLMLLLFRRPEGGPRSGGGGHNKNIGDFNNNY